METKILILGAGFIGMSFIRKSLQFPARVVVLDRKPIPSDLVGKVSWITGDFRDLTALSRALKDVDTVFHFISSTVPGDQMNIALEVEQNIFQTLQLLDACVSMSVRQIIFTSSASVYGIHTQLPIAEDDSTNPISAHGIHKLMIEKYLLLYKHVHGLQCKILRLSNPYGIGQNIDGRQGFIAIAIGKILKQQPVFLRGDGSTVRDFVGIDDVCEAIRLAATVLNEHDLFNVGSGHGISLTQVVNLLENLVGRQIPVVYTETRSIDIPQSVLDISRATKALGFVPKSSLELGLEQTIRFYSLM